MSGLDFPPPTAPPRRPLGPAGRPPDPATARPVGAYAAWSQRAGAVLLDGVIATIATVVLYAIGIGLLTGGGGLAAAGLILVLAVYLLGPLVAFAFYAWQTCRPGERNGQTIGKHAVGIRVVRADGRQVGFGTVLMRHTLIGFFYLITLGIGIVVDYLWPLWDERNQSLHDKLAKTYVVGAYGTVPAPPLRGPAPPAFAPPAGRPRPVPAAQQDATAAPALNRAEHGLFDRREAATETLNFAEAPPTEAYPHVAGGHQPGARRTGGGQNPWVLAGCLMLALVLAGAGFAYVVHQGAKKVSDAIVSSSLANANAASTPDYSTATDTTATDTTATDTTATDTTTTDTTPTDPSAATVTATTPGSGTTYPILSGVTGEIIVRSGPSTSASIVATIPAGGSVMIDCQSHGDTVTRGSTATDVWDHITQPDGYVTDTVIDTGSSGTVASDCGTSGGSGSTSSGSTGSSTGTPPNGETVRACDPNISADTGTTCPLAENTFRAYAAAIKSGGDDETVRATSPASGRAYTLACSSGSDDVVVCAGAQTIYITFPLQAAEIY